MIPASHHRKSTCQHQNVPMQMLHKVLYLPRSGFYNRPMPYLTRIFWQKNYYPPMLLSSIRSICRTSLLLRLAVDSGDRIPFLTRELFFQLQSLLRYVLVEQQPHRRVYHERPVSPGFRSRTVVTTIPGLFRHVSGDERL